VRLVKVEDVFCGLQKRRAEHFASGVKLYSLFTGE